MTFKPSTADDNISCEFIGSYMALPKDLMSTECNLEDYSEHNILIIFENNLK